MGPINICLLWLFASAAAYTDFRYRKVPNRLLVIAGSIALVLATCGGWEAFKAGLAGLALGLLLLLPAFTLHMVGGGDVKSLAVMGLFTGPHLLWISFLRGAVIGGIAGLAILATRVIRRWHGPKRGIFPADEDATAWTLPYAGILLLCAAVSALVA